MVFGHRAHCFLGKQRYFWGLDGHDCFFTTKDGAFKNYLKLKHPSKGTNISSHHLGTGKNHRLEKCFFERDMAVSKNRGGPPKWMVYNGKPY